MKPIRPEVNLPEMEREVLSFWAQNKVFEKSNDQRSSAKEFAFYDGPPFANGLPHYGHLLANTVKDIVPRYWVMKGYKVDRRFGWDCHGVPVEYEIEKRDNLKGSGSIKAIGVAEFNRRCKESVLHYADEWQKTIRRLGRWVDWNRQYRTMDLSYMESVWWVLKELHTKGLVYSNHKVVPYSSRITSVLSNFEANQNYKITQDPSVYVSFKIKAKEEYFLAWTTTPWTLISNLALAVGPEIKYLKVQSVEDKKIYWIAESRVNHVFKKLKDKTDSFTVLETKIGKDLEGISYEPLFTYFKNHSKAFVVLVDDYVTTESGTGIVHQAPAYGEDDFRVCRKAGIDFVDPIDEEGVFKDQVPELSGKYFKDADKEITRLLKNNGNLFRQETIDHSYPFCERTDTPLMFRAVPAWFVSVEKNAPNLVKNNAQISWVPDHLRDGRMGKWLEGAKDWAISRNRFWGTPLPIWICDKSSDHVAVFGSVKSLESRSGVKLEDIHKEFVDPVTFQCEKCSGTMKRVPEVFDCWFESGAMPYAQLHYPFENKDRLLQIFPADFIAEGLDQTRGWFYTLTVLSTLLFDKPAFRNVVVNGIICDETGKKMSKRHRNYTPPDELLEKFGADATRLYMINSPILRGEDLIFSDKGVIETIRGAILPLWNSHSFLTTYGHASKWAADLDLATGKRIPAPASELDQWILSRLQTLLDDVKKEMESYKIYAVVPCVLGFIDDLTNWYIRLSRRRFWEGGQTSKDAFETLYYVLIQFCKVLAPLAPFVSERIYRNLTDHLQSDSLKESVHLCDMPVSDSALKQPSIEHKMKLTRRVAEMGRSLRAKHQLKTRQPLKSLLVITKDEKDRNIILESSGIICDELNIKGIQFSTDETRYLNLSVKPNLKSLGKKLGSHLNQVRIKLEEISQDPQKAAGFLHEVELSGQGDVSGHLLTLEDLLIARSSKDESFGVIASEGGVSILLETKIDEPLRLEGLAREMVNRIQTLRKDSDFEVSDRILLKLGGSPELKKSFNSFRDYLMEETLAQSADWSDELGQDIHSLEIDEMKFLVTIRKS